jgi:hypothetical protein
MNSLITAVTILILAGYAQGQVAEAVSGWEPFAEVIADD